MSYTQQVERLIHMVEHLSGFVVLAADATGVGRGVVDILHEAIYELADDDTRGSQIDTIQPAYITITGGSAVTKSPMGLLNVPKRELVTTPLILFQDRRLHISEALEYQDLLQKELLNFKVKINIATGHDSYEAWREGEHDDLVLALSLACWVGNRYLEEEKRAAVPGIVVADAPVFAL